MEVYQYVTFDSASFLGMTASWLSAVDNDSRSALSLDPAKKLFGLDRHQ